MSFEIFQRYRPIIDDWPAFIDALNRPLPICIWANTSRISANQLHKRLTRDGIVAEPVAWYPGAFRLPANVKVGNRIEYLAGLCHVQEEVALLPAVLLDPQPGERVLELCAAPGNKAAQMSLRMQQRGTIIANDFNHNRMRAFRHNIERLGLMNISATLQEAVSYPKQPQRFDRVLVDVPCSCEGTSRKSPEVLTHGNTTNLERLQYGILRRGLQLCEPGGRVVYSTCTYAPEENEVVVQRALDSLSPKIHARILEVDLPGMQWSPGLENWNGTRFRRDMRNAIRIYPHQNDTGGFFVAVIERLNGSSFDTKSPTTDLRAEDPELNSAEAAAHLNYLEDHFGIPRLAFEPFRFFRANTKSISIIDREHQTQVNPYFAGLPFIHTNMNYPKLSTAAALTFGKHATRNVVHLSHFHAEEYLMGKTLFDAVKNLNEGYVFVKEEEITLGMGVFFQHQGTTELRSSFPKAWQLAGSSETHL